MVYIHYFAAEFLFKTEVFWLNIYLFLIKYYLTPLVVNIIVCLFCYYLLTPSLLLAYYFFLWLFTIFFLLFFKVYFTRDSSSVMVDGGKKVKAIYVTNKIISSVFYNLYKTCVCYEQRSWRKANKIVYYQFCNYRSEHTTVSRILSSLHEKSSFYQPSSPQKLSSIKSIDIKFLNWLELSFSISLIIGYLFIYIFLKVYKYVYK